MKQKFAEVSIEDLVRATEFLHHVRPSLKNMLVYAIEEPNPNVRNVMFHLIEKNTSISGDNETEIFMLSPEYILEHPFWDKLMQTSSK